MDCKKTLKLLPLYISDDLDERDAMNVEKHVGVCLNCYREYQAHLKSLRALKQLSSKPDLSAVLDGFSDEVMERVALDGGGPSAPLPRVVYPALRRSLAAAAVLLAAVVGFYLLSSSFEPAKNGSGPAYSPSHTVVVPGPGVTDPGGLVYPDEANPMRLLTPEERERRLQSLKTLRFPEVQPANYDRDF